MRRGFTFIELIIVMGIFGLLASLMTINFFNTYPKSNVQASEDILIADLKSQQSRAMVGEGVSAIAVSGWGLKVFSDHYVLFSGSSYNPSATNNVTINTPTNLNLTTNLPSSGEVVFMRGTGEILGFIPGSDSITLTSGTNSRVVKLNQYGTIVED